MTIEFEAVEREAIPSISRGGGNSKADALITEFLNSGLDAIKLTSEVGKGFSSALNKRAKEAGQPVKAMKRGGELFLVRDAA